MHNVISILSAIQQKNQISHFYCEGHLFLGRKHIITSGRHWSARENKQILDTHAENMAMITP